MFATRAAKVLAPRETPIGKKLPYDRHLDPYTLITRDGLLV